MGGSAIFFNDGVNARAMVETLSVPVPLETGKSLTNAGSRPNWTFSSVLKVRQAQKALCELVNCGECQRVHNLGAGHISISEAFVGHGTPACINLAAILSA